MIIPLGIKPERMYVIGSRASGTHNRYSDVDVAVISMQSVSLLHKKQAELDSMNEEEYLEGRPEGRTEFDVHLVKSIRKPAILIWDKTSSDRRFSAYRF